MAKKLMPLYYAILKQFMDGETYSAAQIVQILEADYGDYKLLTCTDVDEALATAKENGLLDEVGCNLDQNGDLEINYQVTGFGKDMIARYLGV